MKKRFLCLLASVLLLLTSCGNQNVTSLEEFDRTMSLRVVNQHSEEKAPTGEKWREANTLYITDIADPFTVNFENGTGETTKFTLCAYANFEQIKLRAEDSGELSYTLNFEAGLDEEVSFPIVLDDTVNLSELDSLFFSVIMNPEENYGDRIQDTKDKEAWEYWEDWYSMDNFYHVCTPERPEIQVDPIEKNHYIQPEVRISDVYDNIGVNQDFDMEIQTSQRCMYPPAILTVSPGEDIPLVYNVPYDEAEENNYDVLVLSTIGFRQQETDKGDFFVIQSDDSGTAVGNYTVKAPDTPGTYDFIAYGIPVPAEQSDTMTDTYLMGSTTSYRFTIVVE